MTQLIVSAVVGTVLAVAGIAGGVTAYQPTPDPVSVSTPQYADE